MALVSGMIRNSISESNLNLFNSLSTKTTSSSSQSNNFLSIDYAEYAAITNGSYNKLTKAYYAKFGNTKTSSGSLEETSTEESTKNRTMVKGAAKDLYEATGVLVSTGSDSLFKKTDIKDSETGVTVKDFDTDKIYKAVNSLVDSYNSLVEGSANSTDNSVLRQTLGMIKSTLSNSSLLSDIGIEVGVDNKLSVDEETFKAAHMSTVKTLFNGSGSLGAKIQSTAANIYNQTNNLLGNSNTYTAFGTLGNYSTGNRLDSLL